MHKCCSYTITLTNNILHSSTAMEYDDLLDRDFPPPQSLLRASSEEEERPAPPPTRATPTPARATATGRRTYAQACTVETVAHRELDRLLRGSGLDLGDVDGLRGRGRGRGHRGGTPRPPWPDQGKCKFATLKTYRTTQFNTVLYSLYAD